MVPLKREVTGTKSDLITTQKNKTSTTKRRHFVTPPLAID